MANLKPYYNKDGILTSYYIRVYRGRDANGKQLKPYTTTFDVNPKWSPEKALEKAKEAAAIFELQCTTNQVATGKMIFADYADRVLQQKLEKGITKQSTYERYLELLDRINPIIGGLRIDKITTAHLNDLTQTLLATPIKVRTMIPTQLVMDILDGKVMKFPAAASFSQKKGGGISNKTLAAAAGTSEAVISKVRRGQAIKFELAVNISEALGYDQPSELFTEKEVTKTLSKKTVVEHHNLISGILKFAVDEQLLPYNPAKTAQKPKVGDNHSQRFYTPAQIRLIMRTIVNEPLYWRILIYICMYTGCRRGEALGLRTIDIDLVGMRIRICQELLYSREKGMYIDTPKTETSKRWIGIPPDLAEMLSVYMATCMPDRSEIEKKWVDTNLVFINRLTGNPYNPDAFTKWCGNLNKKYEGTGMPHINPHAFRHSYASALIFSGRDVKSIQHQLGHAKASTTENIYGHFFEEAVEATADDIRTAYGDILTEETLSNEKTQG